MICCVFIVLGVHKKYFLVFDITRAPEHTETVYFWKEEDHNFHHILIRDKKIKIGTIYLRLHAKICQKC